MELGHKTLFETAYNWNNEGAHVRVRVCVREREKIQEILIGVKLDPAQFNSCGCVPATTRSCSSTGPP